MSYRNWVFTLNQKKDDDLDTWWDKIETLFENLKQDSVNKFVFQWEAGTNDHLQGFISFKTPKRITAVKEHIGYSWVHLEKAMGTAKENYKYCTKEDTRVEGPWFWGDFNAQGKRNDLILVKEQLDKGKKLRKIAEDDEELFGTIIRNQRGLNWYCEKEIEPYVGPKLVVCFYGEPGTGKSYSADFYSNTEPYLWTQSGANWWDGYVGQKTLILNDFSGGLPFTFLKQLLDRYPVKLNRKGLEMVNCAAEHIFFTSNIHPEDWYNKELNRNIDREALMRRIDILAEFIWNLDANGNRDGSVKVIFKKGADRFLAKLPAPFGEVKVRERVPMPELLEQAPPPIEENYLPPSLCGVTEENVEYEEGEEEAYGLLDCEFVDNPFVNLEVEED